MSVENQAEPARKAPRWMKVILVISLALNLLIFGAIGARFAFGPAFGPSRGLGAPGVMLMEGRRMMRKLPPQRRRALREIFRMHRMELREHRRKIAKARASLARQMAQDKLDMAAYKAELVKMQQAEAQGYETVMRMRGDFLNALTKAERQMFARNLLKHKDRRPRPRRAFWQKHF
jgi:uncharacterized membrane protein